MANLRNIVLVVLVGALAVVGAIAAGLIVMPARGGQPALVSAQVPATGQGISIVSEGSASARPDQAWVSVGAQAVRPTAAEAMAEASRLIEAILAKLDSLGIPRAQVQTGNIGLFPVQDGAPRQPGSEPTITGYRASNSLTVQITDLAKVGPVLDGAVTAGANQVGGVRFGIKDDTALRNQAMREATGAARAHADLLAGGLGLRAGEVLSVREDGASSPVPAAQADLAQRGGSVPVEAGQLTVRVRVSVTFALVPNP